MSIRVYIEGGVVDPERAMVPVFDRGFLFGDSVYETIAFVDGRFLFADEHLARLERSAHALYLEPPPRAQIAQAMHETALATGENTARIRVIVTRGSSPVDIDPATAGAPRLVVIAQPLGAPTPAMLANGVGVEIVSQSRAAGGSVAPSIKSGNYLNSVLAIAEARRRRSTANEAILCSPAGSVAEGATSNVFFVAGGVVCTPGLEVGILDGVTRTKVLGLAWAATMAVREPSFVAPSELRAADEVFLTSAVRGILPVTAVDGAPVGDGRPGPMTRRLLALYEDLLRQP